MVDAVPDAADRQHSEDMSQEDAREQRALLCAALLAAGRPLSERELAQVLAGIARDPAPTSPLP